MDKAYCFVRMTPEMAEANVWATDAMIAALLATMPTDETTLPDARAHVRRLRALEHLRTNLIRAMETSGWTKGDQ